MSVDSKLWKLVASIAGSQAHIIEKATGDTRTVMRDTLPSWPEIAAMHENEFDRVCREAFVRATQP